MFIMDTPDLPQQRPQVMLVQAAQTQQTKAQYDRIVGVCDTAEARGGGGLAPVSALQNYFSIIEKKVITGASTVTVLEMPKHGELYDRGTMINRNGKLVDSGERSYYFTAKPGYFGEDRVVFMVEMGGMKVKVVYSLHVTEISDDEVEGNHCPVPYQKLENSTGEATSSQSFLFNFAQQGGAFSGLGGTAIAFADLPGAAVGQTVGSSITLDTNAAGHNWYIDTTPADNSEYLPTSNPYEWVAKEGTAAQGKPGTLFA